MATGVNCLDRWEFAQQRAIAALLIKARYYYGKFLQKSQYINGYSWEIYSIYEMTQLRLNMGIPSFPNIACYGVAHYSIDY